MNRSSFVRLILIAFSIVFFISSCSDPRNYEFSGSYNIDRTPNGEILLKCSFKPYTRSYGIDVVTISQIDAQNNIIEGCGGQKAMSTRLDEFFSMKDFTIKVKDKNGTIHELQIEDGWFRHSNVGLMGKNPETKESVVIILRNKKRNPNVSYKKK